MQTPKKGTVKKTVKKEPQSDRKLKNQAGSIIKDFKNGFNTSYNSLVKPFVDGFKTALPSKKTREGFVKGLKTVVPKSKNVRKAIESSPEYKVAKGIKKAAGYKKGGMIRTKKK